MLKPLFKVWSQHMSLNLRSLLLHVINAKVETWVSTTNQNSMAPAQVEICSHCFILANVAFKQGGEKQTITVLSIKETMENAGHGKYCHEHCGVAGAEEDLSKVTMDDRTGLYLKKKSSHKVERSCSRQGSSSGFWELSWMQGTSMKRCNASIRGNFTEPQDFRLVIPFHPAFTVFYGLFLTKFQK